MRAVEFGHEDTVSGAHPIMGLIRWSLDSALLGLASVIKEEMQGCATFKNTSSSIISVWSIPVLILWKNLGDVMLILIFVPPPAVMALATPSKGKVNRMKTAKMPNECLKY